MDAIGSSETSVLNQITLRNNPEDRRIQLNCDGNLRCRTVTQLVKKFPAFYELESSLPRSQHPQPVPTLRQINPVHTIQTDFFTIRSNITLILSRFFTYDFLTKIPWCSDTQHSTNFRYPLLTKFFRVTGSRTSTGHQNSPPLSTVQINRV